MSSRKALQEKLDLLAKIRQRKRMNQARTGKLIAKKVSPPKKVVAPKNKRSLLSTVSKVVIILLIVAVIIWGILYLYKRFKKKNNAKNLLNYSVPANKPFVIENNKIPKSEYGNEYTLSYWMYLNDWEFKNKLPKSILFRGDKNAIATNPGFWFYPENNRIKIAFQLQSFQPTFTQLSLQEECPNSMNPINNPNFLKDHKGSCDMFDVPLQRWNHICVSIWNQSVDVYLNGKLVRSCVMHEYPVPSSGDIHIGHEGGFNGSISTLDYYPHILKPEEIYNIYTKGPTLLKKDVDVRSDGDYAVVV
tara:strand:- start:2960 stop:3871 length:912 start_codon:yes stop_codon:yes gene_type:complete